MNIVTQMYDRVIQTKSSQNEKLEPQKKVDVGANMDVKREH